MGLIITLLLGALVGWLASLVTNRDAEQGWVANVVVGVIGAVIGSFLSSGGTDWTIGLNLTDIFWAFVGAVVLCVLVNLFTRRSVR